MSCFELSEAGTGRPALILHGGGGPLTVAPIAAQLSATAHTLTPVHPGWDGTPRPEWLTGIDDLAIMYLDFLADRGYGDVVVIGSSIGGWIGAEMALRDRGGLISDLVLIDAVGIEVDGESIADIFSLQPAEIAALSFHDASKLPPVAPDPRNLETLKLVAGDMVDPKLRRRLARVTVPTLVLWGESDGIVSPAYGRGYADAFANARFELLREAGHLPQLEQPAALFQALSSTVAPPARSTSGRGAPRSAAFERAGGRWRARWCARRA